jgi:uncharacterized SAM-binding protein YcdF (DUF218 family)
MRVLKGSEKMGRLSSFILQTLVFLAVLLILLGGAGLFFAGEWLVLSEQPAKSDAIVLLSGGMARPLYGADLYQSGYAPAVYVSRPKVDEQVLHVERIGIRIPRNEERYKEILLRKGVPEEAIRFYSQGHVSTVEEAESLRKTLGNKPIKLLVVTSPYHTRRAKAIFRNVLPNAQLRVVATPYESFDSKWWTDKNSAIAVVLETVQTLYYHLGGAFRSTDLSPLREIVSGKG